MKRIYLIISATAILSSSPTRAETATQAVDRVWAYQTSGSRSDDQVLRFNKRVADEQGTAVIAPILARSKGWHNEEVLNFVPLVIELPPQKSVPVLVGYFKHGKPWEKTCANDLLTEIDMGLQQSHRLSEAERKRLFAGWQGL
jgi:hypothetical protein